MYSFFFSGSLPSFAGLGNEPRSLVSLRVRVCACVQVSESLAPRASSHFSLEVALGRVRRVGGGGVPVLIVQLHALLLLPRHDGQLRGHVLEAVPGALALWG